MKNGLIKYPFDVDANKQALIQKYTIPGADYSENIARGMLASHATSRKNLLSILQDNKIYSYNELTKLHPKVVENNLLTTTDQLDIQLGLDNFVFLSMGRGTVSELVDHYLCFKHDIIWTKNALASLIEIAECGALVSPQTEQVHKILHWFTSDHIAKINDFAAQRLFSELVRGTDFDEILTLFLRKHYQTIRDYTTAQRFPEQILPQEFPFNKLNTDRRQGPQLMIPHELPLDDKLYALIDVYGTWDLKNNSRGKSSIRRNQIVRIKEVAKHLPKEHKISNHIFQKNPEGMEFGLMILINLLMQELWYLSMQGYEWDMEAWLIDLIKTY